MTTWFTSDLHLGHLTIIKYCNRPFRNARDMDEALIKNWNAVVKEEDTVYHLGDLAMNNDYDYTVSLVARLNGEIHHIEGNHDRLARMIYERTPYLKSWNQYLEIEVEGQRFVLFHYALRTWHHDLRGVIHLYGHSHAGLPPFGKSVDCGVDNAHNISPAASYRPLSFEEIRSYMDKRSIGQHPKFEGHPNDTR